MPCPNSARKRSKTMAFRVSPEEYERITNLAKLSGMDKQDFILAKLMDHEIVVKPSTRVYKALKDTMAEIYQQLSSNLSRYHRSPGLVPAISKRRYRE